MMTTYDIEQPDHGGKLRSHHIRRSLRTSFDVETLSFEWQDKDDASTFAIKLNQQRWSEFGINGIICDWGINLYLDNVDHLYKQICTHIEKFNPDVIMLEQPFLWPLAKKLSNDKVLSGDIKIIYSSHNIEFSMKHQVYQESFLPEVAIKYAEYVDNIERNVIKECDGALAVSSLDADYITEVSLNARVKIYANGHSRPIHGVEDNKWEARFSDRDINWVYVGSWHPPNINGLRDLVLALSRIKEEKNFALWVLGGVGNALIATTPDFDIADYPWLKITGLVSAEDIDSAILCSNGVVLPVWEGGGSNLKTSQALLSSKCILGAEFSFRSFEKYAHENGVFLVKDADNLAQLLNTIHPDQCYDRSKEVDALEWEGVLQSLPDYIHEIVLSTKE